MTSTNNPFDCDVAKDTAEYQSDEQQSGRSEAKSTGKDCPVCGEELLLKMGRRGSFLGCSAFPECPFTVDPTEAIEAPPICPKCGELMRKRQGNNGIFYGCTQYPHCSAMRALSGEPIAPTRSAKEPREVEQRCPLCDSAMLEHDGPRGAYLRCSNKICNKTIDAKALQESKGKLCDACEAPMVVRKGSRGRFLSCTRYPKCKASEDLDAA